VFAVFALGIYAVMAVVFVLAIWWLWTSSDWWQRLHLWAIPALLTVAAGVMVGGQVGGLVAIAIVTIVSVILFRRLS
jgi:hypothetical protein